MVMAYTLFDAFFCSLFPDVHLLVDVMCTDFFSLLQAYLIFPKGNNVDHLSMYLDVADAANLPYGWSRYSQFSLAVVNQVNNRYSIRKGILVN